MTGAVQSWQASLAMIAQSVGGIGANLGGARIYTYVDETAIPQADMAESFAGITVPEGEPGTIRDAATTFRGVAGGLHGVSGDLQAVPGLVADWKGLAASAFRGTVSPTGAASTRPPRR